MSLEHDNAYLEQANAHGDDGTIGEVAARGLMAIAERTMRSCERLAQTIYIHCSEEEIRKSLPAAEADFVISRRGGPAKVSE